MNNTISDDLFARFMDGQTTPAETIAVHRAMREDKELREAYIRAKRFDALMEKDEEPVLPLEKMAAKSEDNLCDILCERYILRNRFPEYGSQGLLGDAKNEQRFLRGAESFDETKWIAENRTFFSTALEKQWLTTQGVALYNVGRIMEGYGLSVTRHFYADIQEIRRCLDRGENLIAIVNEEILDEDPAGGSIHPDHAVCVLSLDDKRVSLYNPSAGEEPVEYPLDIFLKAWNTSKNYLVAVGLKGEKIYEPSPINLDDIELDDNLNDLLEAIAENAHDVWAVDRMAQGYVYGDENNSDPEKGALTNKDLRPYSELPEKEKDYDRKMATATLKLAQRLGFKIVCPDSEEEYHCPDCGERIQLDTNYCPNCGRPVQLDDFI